MTQLVRTDLIDESLPSSSGGDTRMDPFAEDFDAFFSRMSGRSSGTLGTSAKGDRPLVVQGAKGKLLISSFGSSRGTPTTRKRKLGSLFTVPRDLMEGEHDPVANKRISHLTDCFLHSSECISTDMAIEAAFYLSHGLRDFSGTSAAQAEVKKLQGEVRLCRSREEKLAEKVNALQGRLDHLIRGNTSISKELEGVNAEHDELLSRHKEMVDKAFTRIMTEVWSVDPELVGTSGGEIYGQVSHSEIDRG